MNKLETIALALAALNSFGEAESESSQKLNPGMLKDWSAEGEKPVRVFTSIIGGYRALTDDLEKKCSGRSRARNIHADSTLADLLASYGWHDEQAVAMVIDFIQRASGVKVSAQTQLSRFLSSGVKAPTSYIGIARSN